MTPEIVQFTNRGMNQDVSISKASNEFAYENYNIRITAINDNTLLSITNEKLPIGISYDISKKTRYNKATYYSKKINKNTWEYKITFDYPITSKITAGLYSEDGELLITTTIAKGSLETVSTGGALSKPVSKLLIDPFYDEFYTYYSYTDEVPDLRVSKDDKLIGTYLGYSILNDKIIIFTHSEEDGFDRIYSLQVIKHTVSNELQLVGDLKFIGDLNFSIDKPIETLPYFESEDIQKVYWVDGRNQPRVININNDFTDSSNTAFDFSPIVNKFPTVKIEKQYNNKGLFPAGVIQYFASYYNKYGAETGIVWASDLQYINSYNKANAPDDTVVCNFKITINNIDTSYDYIRVYSIQRTSLNGTPVCTVVKDVNINNSTTIVITDNNITNEIIDPTTLLFLGGDSFIASTITQKDDTLFLGNLEIKNKVLDTNVKDAILSKAFTQEDPYTSQIINFIRKPIDVENQLNYGEETIKTFKYGERYRFALQFQDKELSWTAPIWVGDKDCDYRPQSMEYITYVASAAVSISDNLKNTLKNAGYINYRLLIAEASDNDKKILAQGIVNPTVFNYKQRCNKTGPYAQTSWILRPENGAAVSSHLLGLGNDKITSEDNGETFINLPTCEIQNSFNRNPLIDTNGKGIFVNIDFYTTKRPYGSGFNLFCHSIIHCLLGYKPDSISDSTLDSIYYAYPQEIVNYTEFYSDYDSDVYKTISKFAELIVNKLQKILNTQKLIISPTTLAQYIYDVENKTTFKVDTLIPDDLRWYVGGFSNGNITNTNIESYYKITSDSPDELGHGYLYTFIEDINILKDPDYNTFKNNFYVDSNIVTFHSPDLNINNNFLDTTNAQFKIVGVVPVAEERTDIEIRTKRAGYSGTSFVKKSIKGTILNDALYEDNIWNNTELNKNYTADYYVYLWQKDGSIIGQTTESTNIDNDVVYADLDHKVFGYFKKSNQTYYWNYLSESNYKNGFEYSIIPRLFETSNVEIKNLNIGDNKEYYQNGYENISTTNEDYRIFWKDYNNEIFQSSLKQKSPVSIKYKTLPHIAFSLNSHVLPSYNKGQYLTNLELFYNIENTNIEDSKIPWLEGSISENYKQYNQENFDWFPPEPNNPYFYVGELKRDIQNESFFGGKDDTVLQSIKWIPASKSYNINDNINISFGDTYYQRWNLVHSIPFTTADQNSVIDTLSFLVETRTNVLGDYSSVNPEENTLNLSEDNTGKINPVYSQSNNYFTYNILDEKFNQNKYFNQVAFSLQKTPTSNIDTWCNISLASAFNLNGEYGKLNKLLTLDNTVLAFQDKALSIINFNNRTAISTESGVPIEIANSGKVNGYSIMTSNVGCQNKYSICKTSSGVYFIDDLNHSLYKFNKDGLDNVSSKGLSMWFKNNLTGNEKCFYDSLTGDIYISNKNNSLVYNEILQSFTSFMSEYKDIHLLFNLNGKSLLLKQTNNYVTAKELFAGEYTNDYFTTYKINPEPLTDKIFTNVEFIADVFKDNFVIDSNDVNINVDKYPFDVLEVWNEYQKGITNIPGIKYRYPNASKKFRICRIDVPRDSSNGRDRIRNPWMYLKLSKNSINDSTKMVFHNLLVKYYK